MLLTLTQHRDRPQTTIFIYLFVLSLPLPPPRRPSPPLLSTYGPCARAICGSFFWFGFLHMFAAIFFVHTYTVHTHMFARFFFSLERSSKKKLDAVLNLYINNVLLYTTDRQRPRADYQTKIKLWNGFRVMITMSILSLSYFY